MNLWPLVPCVLAACIAAVTDLRSRTIPNWLTYPLLLGALLGHGLSGTGGVGLLAACFGCLVCFAPSYFLFTRGGLGGGDVKLFAAFGALLGARDGLELELAAFTLVCAFTVWRVTWNGRLGGLVAASYRATLHMISPTRFARPAACDLSQEQPMGLAILFAAFALTIRQAL